MAGSPGAFPREIHHALDQQALLLRSGRKREETVGDWAWKEISRAQTDPRDLQWPENRVRPLVVACSSPQIHAALSLVKARLKGKVCYLITHERVQTEEQAWEIFVSYNRRWQIETSFRYGKCELAMESPRLWSLENRLKLLGIVLLVSALLLFLLEDVHHERVKALLRLKCHRTGKRCQEALGPLYRLRWALSRLWDDCRPILGSILLPHLETFQ